MSAATRARPGREPGHLVRLVHGRLGTGAVVAARAHPDGDRFDVRADQLVELVAFLQQDPDADLQLLVHITGLDLGPSGDVAAERFEVHYHLRSPRLGYRALITVRLAADDATVPSLTGLHAAAEMLERELHDMVGIYPEGHPKLRPALLHAGFMGYPLRKDYEAHRQQPLVASLAGGRTPRVVPVADGTVGDARAPAGAPRTGGT